MNRATFQFREAEAAVKGDPTLSRHLRRDRLVLDHAWLLRCRTLRAPTATVSREAAPAFDLRLPVSRTEHNRHAASRTSPRKKD